MCLGALALSPGAVTRCVEIPPHATDDDLTRKMTPWKEPSLTNHILVCRLAQRDRVAGRVFSAGMGEPPHARQPNIQQIG
jgi:hypothetical protein